MAALQRTRGRYSGLAVSPVRGLGVTQSWLGPS